MQMQPATCVAGQNLTQLLKHKIKHCKHEFKQTQKCKIASNINVRPVVAIILKQWLSQIDADANSLHSNSNVWRNKHLSKLIKKLCTLCITCHTFAVDTSSMSTQYGTSRHPASTKNAACIMASGSAPDVSLVGQLDNLMSDACDSSACCPTSSCFTVMSLSVDGLFSVCLRVCRFAFVLQKRSCLSSFLLAGSFFRTGRSSGRCFVTA